MIEPSQKQAFIFDLDGTLADSKQPIDAEMADLLRALLERHMVAIISGGSFTQIERQVVYRLPPGAKLENLFIFPASGTSFYRRSDGGWGEMYSEKLSDPDKAKIKSVILDAEARLSLSAPRLYGEKIEDRGSQMTYSALGQNAPIDAKKGWDPDQTKRKAIAAMIVPFLSGFSVGIGGMTSIDITKSGADKGFGIRKISEALDLPLPDMIFIGDALFPGGNDYPARSTGIDCFEVANPSEAKAFIRHVLA